MKLTKAKSYKEKIPDQHGFRKQLDDTQKDHQYGQGLEIYCDGSCRPHNPGPGRYGFVVVENNVKVHEWIGGKRSSNNAEMEVWALNAALMFIVEQGISEPVTIHTDSGYCCNGYNSWMHNWVKANWKGKKYPTEWKGIYGIWQEYPNVTVKWIAAHSGHQWNEYIDKAIGRKHQDKSLEIERPVRGLRTTESSNPIKKAQDVIPTLLTRDALDEANMLLQTTWNNWLSDDGDVHGTMSRIKEYLTRNKLI